LNKKRPRKFSFFLFLFIFLLLNSVSFRKIPSQSLWISAIYSIKINFITSSATSTSNTALPAVPMKTNLLNVHGQVAGKGFLVDRIYQGIDESIPANVLITVNGEDVESNLSSDLLSRCIFELILANARMYASMTLVANLLVM
jgi:hypothetical protein